MNNLLCMLMLIFILLNVLKGVKVTSIDNVYEWLFKRKSGSRFFMVHNSNYLFY